jgi:hypothetical protein
MTHSIKISLIGFVLFLGFLNPCAASTQSTLSLKGFQVTSNFSKFEAEGYQFTLMTSQDRSEVLGMYAQDPVGTKLLFGSEDPANLIDDDITANESFITNSTVPSLLTWRVNESGQTSIIGVLTAQIMTENDQLIKDINNQLSNTVVSNATYVNMNRFVDKTYRENPNNKGIGTKLCIIFTKGIFASTNTDFIISYSSINNTASQTSAERCGFMRIGEFTHDGKQNILLIKPRS